MTKKKVKNNKKVTGSLKNSQKERCETAGCDGTGYIIPGRRKHRKAKFCPNKNIKMQYIIFLLILKYFFLNS